MAARSLNPGKILGHFRLVEELGAGGMGVVYRAHDTILKRDVALKVLNAQRLTDEKARQRFRSEALILSRLSHPNVEYVHEFRSDDGIDYLVLEYVPGITLNELIKRGALPEQEVIGLGIQLARGLAAAHAQRVLHRDLKPGNLRLTPDNVLKILDFGLAELMVMPEDDTLEVSQAQSPLAGTPAYLSPEQIQGRDPDARSDIYSAGVVLYELATGSKPFPQGRQTMVEMILHSVPPAPRAKNKEISPELEAIILKCLEKDPRQRYQAARDLQLDLEQLSTEHHPSGRRLASPELHRIADNRRNIVVAAVVLVALSVTAFYLWRGVQPKPPRQRVMAVLPMDTVGQDPATNALGLGLTETVAAKLVQASDMSAIQVVSPQDLRDRKVKTAEDAQRTFGADYVLESSMQRSGTNIRINCSLVDPKTHGQIAAKTIESDTTDPFSLQDKVVTAALDMMAVRLKPEERQKLNAVKDTQPAAYDAYIRGRGYLQEYEKPENIENAIAEFTQAVKIDPNYALGYAGLGDAYWMEYTRLDKGNEVAAKASGNCEKALSLSPDLSEAHICLATILSGSGKYERAIDAFKRVAEANPQNYAAMKGLAEAYAESGNLPAAESTYRQIAEQWPNYWSAQEALGYFYFEQARYQDAAAAFLAATRLAPDNFQGFSYLGGTYIALGHYGNAIAALQRSIDLRPTSDAYGNLGYTFYLMHQFPEAIAADEKAISLNGNYWENWGNLADALYWSPDQRAKAAANYRRALDLASAKLLINPQDPNVLPYVANYYAMLGDRETAVRYIQKALTVAPSNPEVLFRAAIVYNCLQQKPKALVYLKKALSLGYSRPMVEDSPDLKSLQLDKHFLDASGPD